MSGNTDVGQVDPNLRLGGDPRSKIRYPSPFFDISQQYVPPTIKELFKWVYYYCTNNAFLGPAIGKIARYPVTDLILEDSDTELVNSWTTILNNTLQMKTFNMSVNLDVTSYGNGFVTIHYPFSRLLECQQCASRHAWKAVPKRVENLIIKGKCSKCGFGGPMKIIDIPFKSIENVRLLRINPEYIDIKYNETTGRHTYLYSIPDRLKKSILAGDPDILEDTPQIYIEAIKQKRKIKLANDNLFHLKNPTLAGKDMGWGMPRIANAMKELYQYYVLRRAQEAVMQEHILPFDIIYPNANGKMDPYTNTDLSSWKKQMERELANRRRDPNYKAIMPFPVGYERIGGDGKALLLTPEMDFIAKIIIGAMGIPQEFVYGGTMNWTGSSVSLRTLENDFLHQRSQLLQMNIWVVERMRLYLGVAAPKTARFSDFKMADDIQKLQLMIGMASNKKLPWEDIQREFGRDPETIRKKIEEESNFEAKLMQQQAAREAEAQARGMEIQSKYQAKIQNDPTGAASNQVAIDKITAETITALAHRIFALPPEVQEEYVDRVKALDYKYGDLLQRALENLASGHEAVPSQHEMAQKQMADEQQAQQDQQNEQQEKQHQQKLELEKVKGQNQMQQQKAQAKNKPKPVQQKPQQQKMPTININMKPLPEQRPPRRKGAV